jgi:hypothetical protein
MRLFLYELRKIWRLPVLIVIAAIVGMYSFMFLSYYFNYAKYGHNYNTPVMVLLDLKAEYGDSLEPDERIDAEKYFGIYAGYLDEFIVGNPKYEEIGIFNGQDFIELDALMANPEGHEEWGDMDDERWVQAFEEYDLWRSEYANQFWWDNKYMELSNYAVWRVQELAYFLQWVDRYFAEEIDIEVYFTVWEDEERTMPILTISERELAHLQNEYSQSGTFPSRNIFPYRFANDTSHFFSFLMIAAIIAIGILLLPTITRDRHSNMTYMQFSSRKGRRILRSQFAAMMTSAFIMSVIIIGGAVTAFLMNNGWLYGEFYDNQIATWFNIPWFDITYIQYIMLLCGLSLLVTMGAAAIFFCLSAFSRDYVGLLLKAIPAVTVLAIIGINALRRLLFIPNSLYRIVPVIGIEFIVSGVVLAVGIGLCVLACKRAMGKDLL